MTGILIKMKNLERHTYTEENKIWRDTSLQTKKSWLSFTALRRKLLADTLILEIQPPELGDTTLLLLKPSSFVVLCHSGPRRLMSSASCPPRQASQDQGGAYLHLSQLDLGWHSTVEWGKWVKQGPSSITRNIVRALVPYRAVVSWPKIWM